MITLLLKSFSCSFIIIIHIFLHTSFAQEINPNCSPSACGNIQNISSPFRLKNDPKECGNPIYELECENNTTSIYLDSHKFLVQAINYHNHTIRLTYAAIDINDNCSFPEYSLSPINFLRGYPYSITNQSITRPITLIRCPYPVNNNSLLLDISAHCFNESRRQQYTYIKYGSLNGSYVMETCSIDLVVMTSLPLNDEKRVSLSEIHSSLLYGFELSWINAVCGGYCRGGRIWYHWFGTSLLFCAVGVAFNLASRILIGMPFMLGLLIYKLRRRHLSVFDVIESFLQNNTSLMPIRYSYSNIKKMTRGFQEKLGEGGYGSVYKGKLRSGRDVAIKVLSNKQRANGQDFINEVATIGRIHHINVVKLVGYCAEWSKCALVYDFMPNGSLEKYIFSREGTSNSLSWETKYEIAVGVARGVEYLHRGCDIQILHFDIKPHNILLDDDFTPKISDFGLAKFYSTENNTVTLTAARGTIGYVAPELINRSIGGVSYKADVYSVGMLLMEMVGLKRNMVANDDESSQYFPYWIYDRFNKGKDIETGIRDENDDDDDDEHERKIMRKMTIVGLWCIQMSPNNRPSMSKVVKMLEGENENLEIPPQPSESPQIDMHSYNSQSWEIESTDSVALLADDASSGE